MATAILVDAAFFIRRFPKIWPHTDKLSHVDVARTLYEMSLAHLNQPVAGSHIRRDLYRIFVYDCPPMTKKVHRPISKSALDFSKTPEAAFRLALHSELRRRRKVALRLGRLSDQAEWKLHPKAIKDMLAGKRALADLTDHDFTYEIRQKGVDIRIGIDICSLTLKKQVDQIVLVSGDSDFVPAAKLARREGVDFVLDPMWSSIGLDLNEHIDGLKSTSPRPAGTSAELTDAVRASDMAGMG